VRELSFAWALLRRGFWHGLALEGVAHFLSKVDWAPMAEEEVDKHFLFFVLLTIAGTLLFELWSMATKPQHPCKDESGVLPLEEEK
jgi:hypothetical protein